MSRRKQLRSICARIECAARQFVEAGNGGGQLMRLKMRQMVAPVARAEVGQDGAYRTTTLAEKNEETGVFCRCRESRQEFQASRSGFMRVGGGGRKRKLEEGRGGREESRRNEQNNLNLRAHVQRAELGKLQVASRGRRIDSIRSLADCREGKQVVPKGGGKGSKHLVHHLGLAWQALQSP